MKVIIAGGRDITSWPIDAVVEESGFEIDRVFCGGATGIDELGKQWAIRNAIPYSMFNADWRKYGKRAGPLRNELMAWRADALILIWDGKSRGSLSMRTIARARRLPMHEVITTGAHVKQIELPSLAREAVPRRRIDDE